MSEIKRGEERDFSELDRIFRVRPSPAPKVVISTELKGYVTRLRQVYAKTGSFVSPDTPLIGEDIYRQCGHNGMVEVCELIRSQLGNGPARDLEYKWDGVGDWRG